MLNVLYGGSRYATEALANATMQLDSQVRKSALEYGLALYYSIAMKMQMHHQIDSQTAQGLESHALNQLKGDSKHF